MDSRRDDTLMTTPTYHGVIPPLATPLAGRDALDVEGLERLIEHVLAGGVHGLFLLGTTGEGPSLSHRTQREFVERCCRQVKQRVPVLVGVTDTSPEESLEIAGIAANAEATAVVLAAPHYFPMSQQDLTRYVTEFAAESPLPVMLYNMPSHTKTAYAIETVRALRDVERVVGVKDSSGQMLYFQQLVELARDRPGFSVMMGPEELLAESVLMGGHGGVCGGANLVPRLYVDLYDAAAKGDLLLTHKLQQRVLRLASKLYSVGEPPTSYLTGLKCALSHLGICSGRLAEPLYEMPAERQRIIAQHLSDLGLKPAAR
jgi:dihydrodipicolinate synthase/N-acetylneuraminate lyase